MKKRSLFVITLFLFLNNNNFFFKQNLVKANNIINNIKIVAMDEEKEISELTKIYNYLLENKKTINETVTTDDLVAKLVSSIKKQLSKHSPDIELFVDSLIQNQIISNLSYLNFSLTLNGKSENFIYKFDEIQIGDNDFFNKFETIMRKIEDHNFTTADKISDAFQVFTDWIKKIKYFNSQDYKIKLLNQYQQDFLRLKEDLLIIKVIKNDKSKNFILKLKNITVSKNSLKLELIRKYIEDDEEFLLVLKKDVVIIENLWFTEIKTILETKKIINENDQLHLQNLDQEFLVNNKNKFIENKIYKIKIKVILGNEEKIIIFKFISK